MRPVWTEDKEARVDNYTSREIMAISAGRLVKDGDILFARTGATTGKSFLVRRPPRAVFASYLIRLRPSGRVLADYLYAFFQSERYWEQVRKSARGGAQPNVNATLLGRIVVPTPGLEEQQRVVASALEQRNLVRRLRKLLRQRADTLAALPGACLRRAFSGAM
jgi:type I restriction enzyme S subunit